MLLAGILSIPLYRSTHLHYSILYYCAFFLAGFLLCDLYITRGEWRADHSCGMCWQFACGPSSGSWGEPSATLFYRF